jgi:hypothetical protein
MSFSTIADAQNAIGRLHEVFEAETLEETLTPDSELEYALEVKGAEFTWDAPPPAVVEAKKGSKGPGGSKKAAEAQKAAAKANAEASAKAEKEQEKIFKLKEIDIAIPRGQLVAIVSYPLLFPPQGKTWILSVVYRLDPWEPASPRFFKVLLVKCVRPQVRCYQDIRIT